MITLYGGGTPNVFKVLIMLGETGLPFEVVRVNVMAQEQFAPEFVALNPNAKIPVLVDDDGLGFEEFQRPATLVVDVLHPGRDRDGVARDHGREIFETFLAVQDLG